MFDCIAMNPPYWRQTHLKMLEKMISAFPEAEIASLSPVRWLQDPFHAQKEHNAFDRYEKTIAQKLSDIEIVNGSFDANLMSNLAIYEVNTKDTSFDYKQLSYDPVVEVCLKNAKSLIKDHLTKNPEEFSCRIPYLHGNPGKKDMYETISRSYKAFCSKKTGGSCYFVNMHSEEERHSFFDSLFLDLYTYLNMRCKVSPRVVVEMPFLEDYRKPWTDNAVYEHLKIDDNLQTVIKQSLQAIHNEN